MRSSGRFREWSSQRTFDSTPSCARGSAAPGSSRLPRVTLTRSLPTARYVNGVPHCAQKPRSAMSELGKVAIAPLVTTNSDSRTPPNAMNGPPLAFWHIRQWQMLTPVGSAIMREGTAPHWQPPAKPAAASIAIALSLPGNALLEKKDAFGSNRHREEAEGRPGDPGAVRRPATPGLLRFARNEDPGSTQSHHA